MGKPSKVLIVEDSEEDAALLISTLQRGGYDPSHEIVETPEAMSDALDRQESARIELPDGPATIAYFTDAHQQLAQIIEFLPDATFVIDSDRKVIAWNKASEEMTGVDKESIIGKGDYAYAVPFY